MQTIRQSYRLIDNKVLSNCYAHITGLYSEYHSNDKLSVNVTVEVMDKDKARSLAQNSLYWKWVTIIADYTGLSKDEQHTQLKRERLARIYMQDDADFAEMIHTLSEYKQHATTAQYELLAQGVAKLLSTTKATVKQMSKYLDGIDKHYYSLGVALPKPQDYQWIIGGDK